MLHDIYMVKSGATTGRVAMVETTDHFNIWSPLAAIRCDKGLISPKFMFHYLHSSEFQTAVELHWSFGTQQNIGMGVIENIHVPLPPLPEQEAIAKFLDERTAKIDTLIAKKRTLIATLKEKRSALISHTVTRGLDPTATLKPSGVDWLGEVPKHWKVKHLDHLVTVKARLGWKGLTASEYVDKGAIFLSTPNIKGQGKIDFKNVNFITKERYLESPEIMLQKGDVLLAKDGSTLGITNFVRELPAPATVNSSIAVLRSNKINSPFLWRWLTSEYIQNIIQSKKDGQGVPHLFQADIRKFTVLLPPLSEQTAIAEYLDQQTDKIDKLTAKVQTALDTLAEYRRALITAAVTGKIDVREEMS